VSPSGADLEPRLRAILFELEQSGQPLPDASTWHRRFPAHREAVDRAFANLAGSRAPAPPAPPGPEPRVLRRDPHGTLLCDGKFLIYRIPAERLSGRGPALLYLDRAERLASLRIPLQGKPEIRRTGDGAVEVRFAEPPAARLDLALRKVDRRRRTRRILAQIARAAELLAHVHDAGGAHGRLGAEHLRVDPATGRLVLDFGLGDGPGRDDGDLEAARVRDLRALGALLHGTLCLEGKEPDVAEILHRAQAGELPSLQSRRPDLLPSLVRAVDRALAADPRGAKADLEGFLIEIERILDHEVAEPARSARPHPLRQLSPTATLVLTLLVLLVLAASAGAFLQPRTGRLSGPPPADSRLEEVRWLVDQGRHGEARERFEALGRALGLR
jgi:hypothetical protein